MADSRITTYEHSAENGIPIECYKFVHRSAMTLGSELKNPKISAVIAMIGDSVASGYPYTDVMPVEAEDCHSWTQCIRDAYKGVRVLNRAIGGDVLENEAARFEKDVIQYCKETIGRYPDICIIEGGANDCWNPRTDNFAEAMTAFDAMVKKCTSLGIVPVIGAYYGLSRMWVEKVVAANPGASLERGWGSDELAIDGILANMTNLYRQVEDYCIKNSLMLCDFARPWWTLTDASDAVWNDLNTDLVHPTDAGYKRAGALWVSALLPELNKFKTGTPPSAATSDMTYLYTSAATDIELTTTESGLTRTEKYFADTISRESITPGSSGSATSCVIKVHKDNAVAKLFEGPPPESPVDVYVYRVHEQDTSLYDTILRGKVGQVSFEGSECELTVDMDSWLSKELPNGMNQYYCNHVLFDHNCKLKKEDYAVEFFIDYVDGKTVIHSRTLAAYPSGYFDGGRLYFGGNVRMISKHEGDAITIKYPFVDIPHNKVIVVPGCDSLFRTCAVKYHNTINFSGIPYVAPTDPEKNPTGQGAYWVDSLVIQRDTNGFVGTITM